VLLKRFVSDSFKPSWSQETVDPSVVRPLSKKDAARLETFIANHPDLLARFNEYSPSFVAIYNARIAGTKGMTRRGVEAKIPGKRFVTELEIDPWLNSLGFDTRKMPPRWTVQFVSPDFRIKDGYLVYRFDKLIEW
jgi:hypothetical protein